MRVTEETKAKIVAACYRDGKKVSEIEKILDQEVPFLCTCEKPKSRCYGSFENFCENCRYCL